MITSIGAENSDVSPSPAFDEPELCRLMACVVENFLYSIMEKAE